MGSSSDEEDDQGYGDYDEECKTINPEDPEIMGHIKTIVQHIFFKCDSRNMGQVKYIKARPFLIEGYKHMHKPVGVKLEQGE